MAKELAHKSAESCRKVRMAYIYQINEFADLLGVKRYSIYMYENGRQRPKLHIVRKYIELAEKKKIKLGIEDFIN